MYKTQSPDSTANHGREREGDGEGRIHNKPKKQTERSGGRKRLNRVVNVLLGFFELLRVCVRVCVSARTRVSQESTMPLPQMTQLTARMGGEPERSRLNK